MDLPEVKPIRPPSPPLHMDDLWATLQGMAPGLYLTGDLHARYVEVARAAGREPASVQVLGQRMRETGSERHTRGGYGAWTVTPVQSDPYAWHTGPR